MISTELQRIIQAKADIVTSIENKGVTVPAGTKIDNLDDYVDQIQQGGGGGEEWTANECFWIQASSPTPYDEIVIRHYYDTSSTNTNPYNIWYQLTDINEEPDDNNWIKLTSHTVKTNSKRIWLYGENLQGFNYIVGGAGTYDYHTIGIDFNVNSFGSAINYTAGGHIMSLISKTKLTGMPVNAFTNFFLANKITDASNIILPNFTSDYCYYQMFRNCTALTTAPALPATTLASGCYRGMFYGCTALTTAPELPATTLANNCYYQMFTSCTNLNYVKCLATDISATACTTSWLNAVAATGTFVKDVSMSSWTTGTAGIPSGWTVKVEEILEHFYVEDHSGSDNTLSISKSASNAPTLTVYTSTDGTNWTSMGSTLTTAITATIPANSKLYVKCTGNQWSTDQLVYNKMYASGNFAVGGSIMSLLHGDDSQNITLGYNFTFNNLFTDATTLVDASELVLPATTLTENCYRNMFKGCTALTAAPELPATTLTYRCYGGMFSGCTSLTIAPELPATTLAQECYGWMFENCTSLTQAPELPATTLATDCYRNMFENCTSLTAAPELPATTLTNACYRNMFKGCTALTTAPALPATTLAYRCYGGIFSGCTSLTIAPELPATTLALECYGWMFENCTSLTQAPDLPARNLTPDCYKYMFTGCTNLNYVKCLATNISASNCTTSWLNGVAATGTFVKDVSMSSWTTGINGIPSGWTVQDAA